MVAGEGGHGRRWIWVQAGSYKRVAGEGSEVDFCMVKRGATFIILDIYNTL